MMWSVSLVCTNFVHGINFEISYESITEIETPDGNLRNDFYVLI